MIPYRFTLLMALLSIAIVVMGYCALPTPRQDGLLPTLTPRIAITVLPTRTVAPTPPMVFHVPTPTVTPRESVLLPPKPSRQPTLTFTPLPTRTPTHDQGTRVPVQRG